MTELIINAPHLQTWRQRLSALAVNGLGWLLWCYFLFPLASLACWSLDYRECSQWVNLSGGYLNLKDMLLVYIETVTVLAMLWMVWVACRSAQRRRRPQVFVPPPVSREELCAAFHVDERELQECQNSRFAVVHFDQGGHIIGLEKG